MGRPSSYPPTVEQLRAIDLADLRRWRMLIPGLVAKTGKIPAVVWTTPGGHDKLGVISRPNGVLFVRRDEQGRLEKLLIPFVFTPTKFGGWRAWFRCPGCGQGCRVLYGVNSLRCRKCRGLRYSSQYMTAHFRLMQRIEKQRVRLGGRPSFDGEFPPKPRTMHWRRYLALRRRDAVMKERLSTSWQIVIGSMRASLGKAAAMTEKATSLSIDSEMSVAGQREHPSPRQVVGNRRGRPKGTDYRGVDAPLHEEMRRLIEERDSA